MFASQFEIEDQAFRNRKNVTAGIITILVHALLLLILLFSILHTPIPPFEDNAGGMAVNYGTDQSGTGDIQPFTYNPGATASSAKASAAAAKTESQPESGITSEDESDVVMHKDEKEHPKPKVNKKAIYKPSPKTNNNENATAKAAATPAPVAPPQPKPDPNAMFSKGAYGKPNGSKSDGTGGGNGDQGNPNGDPNSRNYLGGDGGGEGGGNGALKGGYSLRGRKKLSLPPPNQCSNQGRVVIAIKVDRTGKVVDATFRRFESTVFDDCNKGNALAAARKATFNADPAAPEIQEGTITYIYEVH